MTGGVTQEVIDLAIANVSVDRLTHIQETIKEAMDNNEEDEDKGEDDEVIPE